MSVLVYVETNFLMSVATGREKRGDDLLATASQSVRIAIPSSCYMESFSAFEAERKSRNRFQEELGRQVGRLRRDVTSENARALLDHVEKARIANGLLLNDVQERLFQFVGRAVSVLEAIVEAASVVRNAVNERIILDPTDNLILHAILDHARRNPGIEKATLTENARDFDLGEVREALAEAGVTRSFRSAADLLGWLGSVSK